MAGSPRAAVRPKPLRMDEAAAYWRDKKVVTRAEWDQLDEGARSRAFTVSGGLRRDGIGQICGAIGQAIQDGTTLADFKAAIAPQAIEAGFGARRIETIFRTNVQTAYMAGRYAQMMAVADSRPYWRYVSVLDRRTRPAHRAMNGLVRRFDDPFWQSFYPPNGFGCRCTVQTLSASQVEARGEEVGKGVPDMLMDKDPVTGMETPVVPMPDLGFGTNVGRDWLAGLTPSELEGELKDLVTDALCRQGRGMFSGESCRPPLAALDPRHVLPIKDGDILKPGLKPEAYVRAFLDEFGIKALDGTAVHRLPGDIPVAIGKGFFIDRSTGEWKVERQGRAPYVRLLARTIKSPFEVWLTPAGLSGRPVTVLRLIRLFSLDQNKVGGFVVFNQVGNRWSAATAFTPKVGGSEAQLLEYLEKQRVGTLMFREELK